jgi:predicted dehydrogenase
MKTVKLGLIGLGFIGQLHLAHSLKIANAQMVAVADSWPKALERAKALGVKKTYTAYTDLLKDPDVEAVLISLPTHLHLKCSREAAEAGKDIFLEKPIAANVEDAKEIISAVERNHVKLMMGYPMRFNKDFRAIKKQLDEGLLGDVENAHATCISSGPFFARAEGTAPAPVPDWWFNPQQTGGGVMMDVGVHIINLLRMFFGEIGDVKGQFGHRFNMDFEDSAMCLARFECGCLAAINVGWYSQQYLMKIDVHGSVKHASVGQVPHSPVSNAYHMLRKGISPFNQPHFDELKYFVDCIANDQTPDSSGLDGLKDLEAISKAYKNIIQL